MKDDNPSAAELKGQLREIKEGVSHLGSRIRDGMMSAFVDFAQDVREALGMRSSNVFEITENGMVPLSASEIRKRLEEGNVNPSTKSPSDRNEVAVDDHGQPVPTMNMDIAAAAKAAIAVPNRESSYYSLPTVATPDIKRGR